MEGQRINRVVVVGGGTAGWLTAAVIAARHQHRIPSGFQVTLVESPNVPTIGVGEGTWPTMRGTLRKIGVSETEFFRECDSAFKQGACFARWTTGEAGDAYYHPLMLPQGFGQLNLVPHWMQSPSSQSFCSAVCPQGELCDQGLAPKFITTPEYQAVANYAYHLDAGKFAPFLQRHSTTKLGVRHIQAEVRSIETSGDGDIAALVTDEAGRIEGDLFVDCTGFAARLLGGTLGVPFVSCSDVLFCDNALAVQVPYESPESPMASHTISTAQSAGWIWDIGLPSRRGVGAVYSSRHTTQDKAHVELAAYLGKDPDKLVTRHIAIRPGHRKEFWRRNCVAVGMAAGFLEPLEASAIVLVELSAKLISEQLPADRGIMDLVSARFNEVTSYRWGRIIDFLKLHYAISRRDDTQFWRDNRDPAGLPRRLQEMLLLWSHNPPWLFDEFDRVEEVFPAASYQYVLYGMGFHTQFDARENERSADLAQRLRRENQQLASQLCASLPRNRELIGKIREFGLQPI
jgi:tryptophan halogenase